MGIVTDPRTGETKDIPGVDQAMLNDYLSRNDNIPGDRSVAQIFGATASDGGSGGDIDRDGDARIDPGYYLVGFSDDDLKFSRDPAGYAALGDAKLSGPVSIPVGGLLASDVANAVATSQQLPQLARATVPAATNTTIGPNQRTNGTVAATASGGTSTTQTLAATSAPATSPIAVIGVVLGLLSLVGGK